MNTHAFTQKHPQGSGIFQPNQPPIFLAPSPNFGLEVNHSFKGNSEIDTGSEPHLLPDSPEEFKKNQITDFSQVAVHAQSIPKIQRASAVDADDNVNEQKQDSVTHLMERAASEKSTPLEPDVRDQLEGHIGHDFSRVRVHQGDASAQAAENLGAKAYTLGNSIYMGSEASDLNQTDRVKLLAHEAVHTVQQGGVAASPRPGLAVSNPADAAEVEAEQIATSVSSDVAAPVSRSLALRDSMRTGKGNQTISRMVSPRLQRDLKGKHPTKDGTFDLKLKTESHPGATNGMSGTIKFTASDKAPDSTNIRLLQIVKLKDASTGKDYVWTGGEANRNKAMTTADKSKGIEGGFFVDHSAATVSPRTAKADPKVSPYYRDYWPNASLSQDGSKAGKTIKEASLWDYPGWDQNSTFSFETAAKAADTGYIFATLTWGFTISDASKGKVTGERANAHRGPSATFGAAVKTFDEFYKNPGSSTAPTK